ncbi:MAG: hypothetical protein HZA35_03165 [Parcubacteria group bacterium]|nr:hypothetical protein [Parcubacteria group bacterium]
MEQQKQKTNQDQPSGKHEGRSVHEARELLMKEQGILATMPHGDDPKRTESWVSDRFEREEGRWVSSVYVDPARVAWDQQSEKVVQAQRRLEQLEAWAASAIAREEAVEQDRQNFLQKLKSVFAPLDGKKISFLHPNPLKPGEEASVEVFVLDACLSVSGDGWTTIIADEEGWKTPRGSYLSQTQRKLAEAAIVALRKWGNV